MSTHDRLNLFAAKVAAEPDNLLFRFSLAKELAHQQLLEEAIPHLERCREGRADWMMPRILLGEGLVSLGRTAEAIPVLREALALAHAQHHEEPAAALERLLAQIGST